MNDFFNKQTCDRCGSPLRVSLMGKFNTDALCHDCFKDERQAPGYAAASEAELQACTRGDFNFPGVGLSAADRAFLAERRKQRMAPANAG